MVVPFEGDVGAWVVVDDESSNLNWNMNDLKNNEIQYEGN